MGERGQMTHMTEITSTKQQQEANLKTKERSGSLADYKLTENAYLSQDEIEFMALYTP